MPGWPSGEDPKGHMRWPAKPLADIRRVGSNPTPGATHQ